jgi:alkanesulfonate monooxygenase SsuD/methylene tetrahydromethanopterin reductase-like flavin-dependent oxidoreductase (luciferase family)
MGGVAGPRAAALAARYADEYNTPFPTLADVRARREAIERACEEAGREPLPFSVMTGVLVGRDRAELAERERRLAEVAGQDVFGGEAFIVGTVDEAAERLGALRDAGVARVMCQHLLHDDLDAVELIGRDLPAAL